MFLVWMFSLEADMYTVLHYDEQMEESGMWQGRVGCSGREWDGVEERWRVGCGGGE